MIKPANRMPPNKQLVSLLLVERLELKPVPIKTKPATGSHRNRSEPASRCSEAGRSEAAAPPVLMVSVAVAFPLASKLIELGLIEHAGADCDGCTEHVSATALVEAFRDCRLILAVEL